MMAPVARAQLTADARRILSVQALRAFVYGLGSIVIGVTLDRAGYSGSATTLVVGTLLAGSAAVSLLLARFGDRIGRRRAYVGLLAVMGIAGTVYGLTSWLPALLVAGLSGTVSTEANDSGPLTAIEQAMLPHATAPGAVARLFGTYNTVAVLAGALGALAAAIPGGQRLLLAYPVAAALALATAVRLSPEVDAGRELEDEPRPPLHSSRPAVLRLAGLFALDSFAGGFVVQTYIAFWLTRTFDASPELLGTVFFTTGLLQALSFRAAVALAERIGLLRTMVFTHLPSNLLLATLPLAPNLGVAVAILFARFSLSQMDVPTRQAYVVGIVEPDERLAAAAVTGTARALARPIAPLAFSPLLGGALGAPFVVAGVLKCVYDLGLYGLFRRVELR
jgi:predicted MFS family arabinose efflux permease